MALDFNAGWRGAFFFPKQVFCGFEVIEVAMQRGGAGNGWTNNGGDAWMRWDATGAMPMPILRPLPIRGIWWGGRDGGLGAGAGAEDDADVEMDDDFAVRSVGSRSNMPLRMARSSGKRE
jgi:hypothetical protein